MKESLDHLPEEKQEFLHHIVEEILAYKEVKPEMIVLFGSYAKGNYVEEQTHGDHGILYCYRSDIVQKLTRFLILASKSVDITPPWKKSFLVETTEKKRTLSCCTKRILTCAISRNTL